MRCEHCDYLLFNLTQPICPECGRSFDHERYRFDGGAVTFNCPHCDQVYFGNDEQGLPQPRQFVCVQCKSPVTLLQLRVVPIREDAFGRPAYGSPWDDRQRRGWRRAWWDTFLMTLVKPGLLFRTHLGTSNVEAWRFAMISNYVGLLPFCLSMVALLWVVSATMARGGGAGFPIAAVAAIYILAGLIGPLIFPIISAALNAVFIQLALLVLAPNRKPIGYTYRVALFSQGPNALMIVPLCGAYVCGLWSVVTLIFGIKEVHQTSGWRASIAVLWPMVLFGGLYVALIVGFVVASQTV